jgi:hypothetical protein
MGIDVYEYTAGGRGKTMCTLRRVSAWDRDVMNVQTWVYGRDVGEHYVAESCSPLSPGREYGVNVSQNSHCISSTHFRLTPDGAVVDLGPNDIACIM